MKTYNALQSTQAIYMKGICIRVHKDTRRQLIEKGIKVNEGLLVEYWGNYYLDVNKITKEVAEALTTVLLPTDSED